MGKCVMSCKYMEWRLKSMIAKILNLIFQSAYSIQLKACLFLRFVKIK